MKTKNSIKALWDVPLFAEQVEVRANRIDAQVIDKVKKEVILIEMSCPWMENRQMKAEEKMLMYGPLRWELKLQYPGYKVSQHNIIMDVLGGYSKDVRKSIKCLIGDRCDLVMKQMQEAMLSSTLNIARNFKILVLAEQFNKKGKDEHLDIFKALSFLYTYIYIFKIF